MLLGADLHFDQSAQQVASKTARWQHLGTYGDNADEEGRPPPIVQT